MIPSVLAKQLEQGIGDYLETTFPMTNEPFKGSVRNMLAMKDSLYHEPYVAVQLPFRVAEEMPTCFDAIHPAYLPYMHQQKAFERMTGNDGRSTLIATGTGSGKTECFLYPILEYCYHHRGERGIKALIIYPMNALASDQAKRIAELIYNSPELKGNVTAGMYVGGIGRGSGTMMSESSVITDKVTMLNNPPDILLTNYKMLDYLLLRPGDADLWKDNRDPETLKYIAVDELHTFDGAQGTDLACLLRRLKSRLGIQPGYLCCIGTSATMGGGDSSGKIREYASEIFGEPFEKDAVITEDRLTPGEFFADYEVTDFTVPAPEQINALEKSITGDDQETYLKAAVSAWISDFQEDILSDEGKIALGSKLMHHSLLQAAIILMDGDYWQETALFNTLKDHYPELSRLGDGQTALDALFALVSYARSGTPGKLRPFLNVRVQLWLRELGRLMGKVSEDDVTYSIAYDLNSQQTRKYLPVINCRDCGSTGWVSVDNERHNATLYSLDSFYNRFFKCDDQITMMFPYGDEEPPERTMRARLCPDCLQVKYEEDGELCANCGAKTIPVYIPLYPTSGKGSNKQFVCPCCGSRSGLSLIGLRSATEISVSISQLFSSGFNNDKKTLAFSDNTQDAAHRAGFFNARTWKFGLRSAIQHYVQDGGDGKSFEDFISGFLAYWHEKMSAEDFVSYFIAPNMTWMRTYEEMIQKRKLKNGKYAKELIEGIEYRLRYELMQEYGIQSKVGRTLQKSGCSCIAFDNDIICQAAEIVRERTINELEIFRELPIEPFRLMVVGFLEMLRQNGAFADPIYKTFVKEKGENYLLANSHDTRLPGVHGGKNAPRFMAIPSGNSSMRLWAFDTPDSPRYTRWIRTCAFSAGSVLINQNAPERINRFILDALIKSEILVEMESPAEYKAYGINKDKVFISDRVASFKCSVCGTMFYTAAENADLWKEAPCLRNTCDGILEQDENASPGYYGKLYSSGDLARINAREHTGMLKREDRETLEEDFKRGKDDHRLWDPNVLSCTPTLEMGIDIGDLSTVVLCSMPPAQAQFLQRAGRAGRKDGNALTLAIANTRPHDLYYYADPLDMISGEVDAPKIFLRASAVLERQFVAYCMDSWVKKGVPKGAIPQNIGVILGKLDSRPNDVFPFNFLLYVQNNLSSRLNSFMQMFSEYLDDSTRDELNQFARGNGLQESPLSLKVLECFSTQKKQQDSLVASIKQLKEMIDELKAKPQDKEFDDEIKELKAERSALLNVLKEMRNKDVFNFLSDEGLLPNYAFPEAGIVLKAVLWRKEDDNDAAASDRKFEKSVYEYNRSASSAISEFAPNNSFYVDGRKLTIDQIDMSTTQMVPWRLCPNCSHAQIEETGKDTASCPQCGSPAWADVGQVRNMLKVQLVYSNMDYAKSAIGDESEDRTTVFYTKQLLVDVDENNDIISAYRMDNNEFSFGYEFAKKAILREINFGEADNVGEKLMVAGVEDVRKGFKICKYCGKVQPEHGEPVHTRLCKTRKFPNLEAEATDNYLFLYREFQTEILRILIPATTMDTTEVRRESFVAAFMLGMREYFGNVDHLRATVSEVPIPDADYRKQYLVIYDSVPGGTGYLKQLMHNEHALIEVFEKALAVMENCSCKDDPQKDGCYHCLFAYRQSRQIGNISRNTAIHMLKAILSGKDNVEKIDKLASVPANALFDSELERRFLEAITRMGNNTRKIDVSKALVNNKEGYRLTINGKTWDIEPQVLLSAEDGVSRTCKPDFVFRPVSDREKKPVAIFTDGFQYHKDSAADDTLKREAIRRSGKYIVWSLSWKDVQNVFQAQSPFATDVFRKAEGNNMYQRTLDAAGVSRIDLNKMSTIELLLYYLQLPDAEKVFSAYAKAYSLALLDPALANDRKAFEAWNAVAAKIETDVTFSGTEYPFPGTFFGKWVPRIVNPYLEIYAGIEMARMKADKTAPVSVFAVLDDSPESRNGKYEEEWNGLWHFFNVMQFNTGFMAVSKTGLDEMVYLDLNTPSEASAASMDSGISAVWIEVIDLLFDKDAKAAAEVFKAKGIAAPDEVGYEVINDAGEVVGTIEMAWTGPKVGYLTEEQCPDKEELVQLGWTIIDNAEEADVSLFGGFNEWKQQQ